MSLRRDTLLRANSLPGHHQKATSKSKKKEDDTKDTAMEMRRRSLFSIPFFPPLRKSSSKKSRSLEASPDPPAWKRKEYTTRRAFSSPARSASLRNTTCECCSPHKHQQETFYFETFHKEPYTSHLHTSRNAVVADNDNDNDNDEIMVSADRFVVRSKSVVSERKHAHKHKQLSSLTHDDVMQQVKATSIDSCSPLSIRRDFNHGRLPTGCSKEWSEDESGAMSMENSPELSNRHTRNTTGEPVKLSRNFTLPLKSQHSFGDSSSPLNTRRKCCSLDSTPVKSSLSSQAKTYPESFGGGNRTPRKFKVYHSKFDTLTQQDYVQLLYGNFPRDHNNNNPTECDNDVLFVPLNSVLCSGESTPAVSEDTTPAVSPLESPSTPNKRHKLFGFYSPKIGKSPLSSPKKSPSKSPRKSSNCFYEQDKDSLTGFLFVNLHYGKGFSKNSDTYVIMEMDSYGHFFRKAKTKPCRGSDPQWEESFEFEIEACNSLRLTCYNKLRLMGNDISGKCSINLTRENLTDNRNHTLSVSLDRGQSILNISLCFSTSIDGIKKCPSFSDHGVFGVPIMVVCKREKFDIPVIVISCIKEIEKRGMDEVGIYRLSGVASEIQQLKKLFNEDTQNALLVLADTDIHAVAGLLKLYFRELPQSLFTSKLYRKFVDGLSITDSEEKELYMVDILHQLPKANKMTALYLFEHLRRVTALENENKMGVNNLATVFGPTVLRPPSSSSANDKENESKSCYVGTFDIGALDVMSQVGIFRYFLGLKNNERTHLPGDNLELWRRLDSKRAKQLEEELMISSEEHLI